MITGITLFNHYHASDHCIGLNTDISSYNDAMEGSFAYHLIIFRSCFQVDHVCDVCVSLFFQAGQWLSTGFSFLGKTILTDCQEQSQFASLKLSLPLYQRKALHASTAANSTRDSSSGDFQASCGNSTTLQSYLQHDAQAIGRSQLNVPQYTS